MVNLVPGRKVVTTAGTAVALVAATTPVASIVITAELDNTGEIVVGDSTVIASAATRIGHPMEPGKSIAINAGETSSGRGLLDIAKVFIDAETNGDGVTFAYLPGNA
jgi:hypothetical protein